MQFHKYRKLHESSMISIFSFSEIDQGIQKHVIQKKEKF